MTREEQWLKESIENYIFAYTGKRAKISDADAQHFTACVKSYLNLCTPSLPSNVDEAAEKNFETMEVLEHENIFEETHRKIFKAGAEWMAGQGETIEGTLGYGPHLQKPIIMLEGVPKFYDGHSQEVIVNIRKA